MARVERLPQTINKKGLPFIKKPIGVLRVNKSELIDAIAADAGLSKADAGKALDATLSAVTGSLKKGDTVSLVGFGTFQVKSRAARTGRNPQTGEVIEISARRVLTFKPSQVLKNALNVADAAPAPQA